jgi:hypothetical protein
MLLNAYNATQDSTYSIQMLVFSSNRDLLYYQANKFIYNWYIILYLIYIRALIDQ